MPTCITDAEHHSFTGTEPELIRALQLLDLQWS